MALSARRSVAKTIALIEKQGGLILPCGCVLGVQLTEMRKLLETVGPEQIEEIFKKIQCPEHPKKSKRR